MEEKALYRKFEELLEEFETTPYGVSKKAHVSQPTLSDWKLGKSEPKRKTLEKICHAYGKDISFFYGDGHYNSTPLTNKDNRDVAKQLDNILESIDSDDGLMFDGVAFDEETKEYLKNSISSSLITAKIMAKEKYTPKKYRKSEE